MIADIHKPDISTLVRRGHFYFGWAVLEIPIGILPQNRLSSFAIPLGVPPPVSKMISFDRTFCGFEDAIALVKAALQNWSLPASRPAYLWTDLLPLELTDKNAASLNRSDVLITDREMGVVHDPLPVLNPLTLHVHSY